MGRGRFFAALVVTTVLVSTGVAHGAEVPVQADWEIVGEAGFSRTPVALPGGRALLTGDLWRVYMYDPSTGITQVADAPVVLDHHFAATLPDGRVLVGGGHDFPGWNVTPDALSSRCFIYDPATDQWTEAAPLPLPSFWIYRNPAVSLPGGVLVTGGSTPEEAYLDPGFGPGWYLYAASRNVWFFDPEGVTALPGGGSLPGRWVVREPMPTTRVFTTHLPALGSGPGIPLGGPDAPPLNLEVGRVTHESVVLPDGRVLLVGGREVQPAAYYGIEAIDIYDPVTDEWTRLANLPSDGTDRGYGGRGFPGVTVLGDGKVLIFGGLSTQLVEDRKVSGEVRFRVIRGINPPRSSSLVFDPSTNTFSRVGNLNHGRWGPLAAPWLDGGGAFAIGGVPAAVHRPLPEAEVFDPATQTWYLITREPESIIDTESRIGVTLTDGTVLTWSAPPEDEQPILVKRLYP